ncbi:MAG: amidohydrolase [Phycisphaera sp. RhM]|nr:amidohydrolase [Phycisphaera sp. RhM]
MDHERPPVNYDCVQTATVVPPDFEILETPCKPCDAPPRHSSRRWLRPLRSPNSRGSSTRTPISRVLSRSRLRTKRSNANLRTRSATSLFPRTTAFPRLKIVINHCFRANMVDGKVSDQWKQAVARCATFENVFLKLSSIVNFAGTKPFVEQAPSDLQTYLPVLEPCFAAFGEDRVIFATNWGVSTHFGSVDDVVRIVLEFLASKGDSALKKGMRDNAIRVYGINPQHLRSLGHRQFPRPVLQVFLMLAELVDIDRLGRRAVAGALRVKSPNLRFAVEHAVAEGQVAGRIDRAQGSVQVCGRQFIQAGGPAVMAFLEQPKPDADLGDPILHRRTHERFAGRPERRYGQASHDRFQLFQPAGLLDLLIEIRIECGRLNKEVRQVIGGDRFGFFHDLQ